MSVRRQQQFQHSSRFLDTLKLLVHLNFLDFDVKLKIYSIARVFRVELLPIVLPSMEIVGWSHIIPSNTLNPPFTNFVRRLRLWDPEPKMSTIITRFPLLQWLSIRYLHSKVDLSRIIHLESLHIWQIVIRPVLWPENLRILSVNTCNFEISPADLPQSLTTLHLGDGVYFKCYQFRFPIALREIACSVKNHLFLAHFAFSDNLEVAHFRMIEHWPVFQGFDLPHLPEKMSSLTITNCSQSALRPMLMPNCCVELQLLIEGSHRDMFSNVSYPNFLYSLTIRDCDELSVIPRTVCRLSISAFNEKIKRGDLPPNLEFLELPSYTHDILSGIFPSSLISLKLDLWEELEGFHPVFPPKLIALSLFTSFLFAKLPTALEWLVLPQVQFIHFYEIIYPLARHLENLKYLQLALDLNLLEFGRLRFGDSHLVKSPLRVESFYQLEFLLPSYTLEQINRIYVDKPSSTQMRVAAEQKSWWPK